jgi:hypothetical protein
MKEIRNKTQLPLKIQLPGGKVLHLGPNRTGQISDGAAKAPGVLKLVESGQIEIVGEGDHVSGAAEKGHAPRGAKHGHPPHSVVRPKGDR